MNGKEKHEWGKCRLVVHWGVNVQLMLMKEELLCFFDVATSVFFTFSSCGTALVTSSIPEKL